MTTTTKSILSEIQLIRAKFWITSNCMTQAFYYLMKSLDTDPFYYEAWMYLASLHEHQGNIPEAIKCSIKATDCDSHTTVPYENLIRCCDLQGNNIAALEYCLEAIKIEPEKHELYDYLAILSQRNEYRREPSAINKKYLAYDCDLQGDIIGTFELCINGLRKDPHNQESYDYLAILSKRIADKLRKTSALKIKNADKKQSRPRS